MHRLIKVTLMVLLTVLSGCQGYSDSRQDALVRYEMYYRDVESTKRFAESSENYAVRTEMTKMPDDTYRYYVVFDEPKIAMYHCAILAVENELSFDENPKMMPSIGVMNLDVSLVPNQINRKEGYMKGLVLSGESFEDALSLHVLVEWSDKGGRKSREFLGLSLQYEDGEKE